MELSVVLRSLVAEILSHTNKLSIVFFTHYMALFVIINAQCVKLLSARSPLPSNILKLPTTEATAFKDLLSKHGASRLPPACLAATVPLSFRALNPLLHTIALISHSLCLWLCIALPPAMPITLEQVKSDTGEPLQKNRRSLYSSSAAGSAKGGGKGGGKDKENKMDTSSKAQPSALQKDPQLRKMLITMQKAILQSMQKHRDAESVLYDTLLGESSNKEVADAKSQNSSYQAAISKRGHNMGPPHIWTCGGILQSMMDQTNLEITSGEKMATDAQAIQLKSVIADFEKL